MKRSFNIKNLAMAAGLGLAMVLVGSVDTNAQTRRDRDRQAQRAARQQQRIAERNARRNRESIREQRERASRGESVYNGSRYNAVMNSGYQQGFQAGQADRRRGKYNHSNVYRGTGSYPNQGDPTSADYLYRQGFLQGYEDGYRGRVSY